MRYLIAWGGNEDRNLNLMSLVKWFGWGLMALVVIVVGWQIGLFDDFIVLFDYLLGQ